MMARVALDDFADKEIARIYLAARLTESQGVEAELNTHNIDYAVEVERYMATAVLWVSEYAGAAFYALAEQADQCCTILRQAGLCAGLMEERDR
jgi:hypothetical protein